MSILPGAQTVAASGTPTVTQVAPESSPTAGGITVTVTGTNFVVGATTVKFDNTASTSVSVASGGASLTALTPAHAAGEVFVTVTTSSGTSAGGLTSTLLYVGTGSYVPLSTPARICDTRAATGTQCTGSAPGANATLANIQVTGSNGVPASAAAAMVKITAVSSSTSTGNLIAYPTGVNRPTGIQDSFSSSSTIPNLAEIPLAPTTVGGAQAGSINVFNQSSGTTDVIVDLFGYVTGDAYSGSAGLMNAIPVAERICDTRTGTTAAAGQISQCNNTGAIAAGTTLTIQVAGVTRPDGSVVIPGTGTTHVVEMDINSVGAAGTGAISAYCSNCSQPSTTNVNFVSGVTAVDRAFVPVGSDGKVKLTVTGASTNIVIDVEAYTTNGASSGQTGSIFNPVVVNRICDSRTGSAYPCSTFASAGTHTYSVAGIGGLPAASSESLVALNVTIVGPSGTGYATVWPDLSTQPTTAKDLQFQSGTNEDNFVAVVAVPSNGLIDIYSSVAANIVIDVEGWYQKAPVVTAAALTASSTAPTYRDSLTLTTTVSPAPTGAPAASGTITFKDGSATLGNATLSAGSATMTTSALTVGTHTITSVYSGDPGDQPSTSPPVTISVNPIATTTTLTVTPNPASFNAQVTLAAAVSPPDASGTVTFKDGTTVLYTGSVAGGAVAYQLGTLAHGTHSLTATYGGDGTHASSMSNPVSEPIGATTTSLTAGTNPSTFGDTVTLTATVSPAAATGTVTFTDGQTTLGQAALSGGSTSITVTTFHAGNHSLQASYGGDSNDDGSTSPPLTQGVAPFPSATVLTASSSSVVVGQDLTLTATVTTSTATGTVTFRDGTATLGTAPASNGVATWSTLGLPAGNHHISASYGGDADHTSSASAALDIAVVKASPTVTLTTPLTAVPYITDVTMTATVGRTGATGHITFYDNGTALSTPISISAAGTASFDQYLPGGHNVLTAVYDGDSNDNGSTSAAVDEIVSASAPSIHPATASPASAAYGASVTLTTQLGPVTGGAPPTGNVTFREDGTDVAVGSVASDGSVTASTQTLSVGTHHITVAYAGDSNYIAVAENSAATVAVVQAVPAITGISGSVGTISYGAGLVLTVGVSGTGAHAPTGTIDFVDGDTDLGAVALDADGIATLTTTTLAVGGPRNITATYLGDGNYSSTAASPFSITVTRGTVATSIPSAVPAPALAERSVTLRTVLSGSGVADPTGTVTFKEGDVVLGNVPVSGGSASLAVVLDTPGTHSITATYCGDGTYAPSTSEALALTVNATIPDAPTGVTATAGNATGTVTWTAPVINGGDPITGYTVTASAGGAEQTVGASATSATVAGLTNGTVYTFTVRAVNDRGASTGADSNSVAPGTIPGAPASAHAAGADHSVVATWVAPSDTGSVPLTGYTATLYEGSTAVASTTVGPSTLTGTFDGLADATAYSVQIAAVNSFGVGPVTTTAVVSPPGAPSAPQNVAATDGQASVTVAWDAPADDNGNLITGYAITVIDGTTPGATQTTGAEVLHTTFSGLVNGHEYHFSVAATNDAGTGPAATSNVATPSGPPTPPTAPTATKDDGVSYVTWQPPLDDGGSAVTGYIVTTFDGSTAIASQSAAADSHSAVVSGLTNGSTYHFGIEAESDLGLGTAASTADVVPAAEPAPTSDAYSTAVLGDSPSLYYRFGEPYGHVAQDDSGNGQGLTYAWADHLGAPGAVGTQDTAVQGPGDGTFLATGTPPGLPSEPGSTGWSAEVWTRASTTTDHQLFQWGNATTGGGYLGTAGGGTQLYAGSWTGGTRYLTTPYNLDDNAWHQVAMTWDGTDVLVYLDGQALLSFPMVFNTASGGTLDVTANAPGVAEDELAFYGSVLTRAQIDTHWRIADNAAPCPASPTDPYGSAVMASSPSLYYRLDDEGRSAADSSGACRTGGYSASTSRSEATALPSGASASANGNGTALLVPSEGLATGNGAWTVEMWTKTTSHVNQTLFQYGQEEYHKAVEIGTYAWDGNGIWVFNGSDRPAAWLPYPIDDGHWHMVAVSYDGVGTATVYVDGQAIGALAITFDAILPGTGAEIGAGGLWGNLDEVAYFPQHLSAAQIDGHFWASTQTGCGVIPTDGVSASILATHPAVYLPLREASGTIAADPGASCVNGAYAGDVTHAEGGVFPNDNAATAGTTGLIASAPSAPLPSGSADRTLSAFVRPASGNVAASLISYGDLASGHGIAVRLTGNDQLTVTKGTASFAVTSPATLIDGLWHQVAVILQGGSATVVVDGQVAGDDALSVDTDAAQPLLIGGDPAGGHGFAGSIADVAINNGAVTAGSLGSSWNASQHLACGSVPQTGYGAEVIADGPAQYYRFDETSGRVANDASGHCLTAAYSGSAALAADGAFSGSAHSTMQAGTSPMVLGSSEQILAGPHAWTMELWQNTTTPPGEQDLVQWGDLPSHGGVQMGTYAGDYSSVWVNGQSSAMLSLPYKINDGHWHMLDVSYDGISTVAVYLDGQAVGTMQATFSVVTPGSGLQIGRAFSGSLDEFAYYPAALSATRIDTHWRMADDEAGCGVPPTDAYGAAVVGDHATTFYALDNAGRSVADYSGNCHTGAYAVDATHSTDKPTQVGGSTVSVAATHPVVLGSADGLVGGTAPWSTELWVKTTSTYNQAIADWGLTQSQGSRMELGITGNVQDLSLDWWGESRLVPMPYPVNDGYWHMIDLTFDGTALSVYLDGQSVGKVTPEHVPINLALPGNGLQLGAGFTGSLANYSSYAGTAALTWQQVNAHWRASEGLPCSGSTTADYDQPVLSAMPVAYYPMTDTNRPGLDASGNCRTAAYRPSATHSAGQPVLDDSATSTDPDGPVLIASAGGLPSGDTSRAIDLWFNTSSQSTQSLFSYGSTATPGSYMTLRLVDASSAVQIDTGSVILTSATPKPHVYADGKWHHVGVAYDGSSLSLSLDGQAVASSSTVHLSTATAASSLMIGSEPNNPYPLAGAVAQFAMYADAWWPSADDERHPGYAAADTARLNATTYYAEVNWWLPDLRPSYFSIDAWGYSAGAYTSAGHKTACGSCTGMWFAPLASPPPGGGDQYVFTVTPCYGAFSASVCATPGIAFNTDPVTIHAADDNGGPYNVHYSGGRVQDGTHVHLIIDARRDTAQGSTFDYANYLKTIQDLLGELGGTTYWAVIGQYGEFGGQFGAVTKPSLDHLPSNAVQVTTSPHTDAQVSAPTGGCGANGAPCMNDTDSSNLIHDTAVNNGWDVQDPNNTFVLLLGAGVEACQGAVNTTCTPGGPDHAGMCGYHGQLGSMVYAVVPFCNDQLPLGSGEEEAKRVIPSLVHELAEAAVNPYPVSDPAWAIGTGNPGEIVDACDIDRTAPFDVRFKVPDVYDNLEFPSVGHGACIMNAATEDDNG
jgi:hypothetical protein